MTATPATTSTNGAAIPNNGAGVPLLPHHHKELVTGSGLTIETIREAGVYSTAKRDKLASMLNWKSYPQKFGAALVFPYFDADGSPVLHRVKPTHPPTRKGKLRKYLQPAGVPIRAYLPRRVVAVMGDASARLLITEGEKKALAATQAGFPCVGLSGVDCWHPKKRMELLPELERFEWQGREVFIAFDSDAVDNEAVAQNEKLLASTLAQRGAIVLVVRVPPGEDGSKMGLDDHIVARGKADFQKLLENAEPPEPPDAGDGKEDASNMDPADEAGYIIAASKFGKFARLVFWQGTFWFWRHGRYVEMHLDEVRAKIVASLNSTHTGVGGRHISDVLAQLKGQAHLSADYESPTWLPDATCDWPPNECLATKTAIAHLPSLIEMRETWRVDATPAFLTTSACGFDIDPGAPRPDAWLTFLDSLWHDDPQCIAALQEWFGYLLTADTCQQKMLLLVGPKRSGKGTIARVLTALVGKGNVAAPTLNGLATNFGLWPLIGKSVAIISDARLSGRADQSIVVERLLSVTGEDSITIDRKNLQPVTLQLPTRFVILTNELPKLTDASGAIVSRVVMLRLTRSFYGCEDHQLTAKLLDELPGIMSWALLGWQRLRERGRFLQPDSSLEALGEMDDLASPVAAFVRDECDVGPTEVVAVADLFSSWEGWCKSQGREKYVGSRASFCRDLMAVIPSIKRKRTGADGDRTRVYEGVGLKAEE